MVLSPKFKTNGQKTHIEYHPAQVLNGDRMKRMKSEESLQMDHRALNSRMIGECLQERKMSMARKSWLNSHILQRTLTNSEGLIVRFRTANSRRSKRSSGQTLSSIFKSVRLPQELSLTKPLISPTSPTTRSGLIRAKATKTQRR